MARPNEKPVKLRCRRCCCCSCCFYSCSCVGSYCCCVCIAFVVNQYWPAGVEPIVIWEGNQHAYTCIRTHTHTHIQSLICLAVSRPLPIFGSQLRWRQCCCKNKFFLRWNEKKKKKESTRYQRIWESESITDRTSLGSATAITHDTVRASSSSCHVMLLSLPFTVLSWEPSKRCWDSSMVTLAPTMPVLLCVFVCVCV